MHDRRCRNIPVASGCEACRKVRKLLRITPECGGLFSAIDELLPKRLPLINAASLWVLPLLVNIQVMKIASLFVLAFSATVSVFGQSIDIEIGPIINFEEIQKQVEVPRISLATPYKSFAHSNGLFFNTQAKKSYSGFGFQNNGFCFGVYDNYLKYSGVKKLAATNFNEQTVLNGFLIVNKKLHVVYTIKDLKQDQFTVYASEVNPDLVLSGNPVPLKTFAELKNYGSNVYVSSSQNKAYLLLTRVLDPKPKEVQKMDLQILDAAFTEVWAKRVETTIMGKDHKIQSISVDDSGNVYALIDYQAGRDTKPVVYAYYWQDKSLKSFEPGIATGVNFGARLELVKGVEPYVIGLNENVKGKEKEIKYFIDRVNTTSQTLEKVGNGAMSSDFRKISNANLFDTRQWNVMHILITGDGGIIASVEAVVIEEKYGVQHSFNAFVFSFRKDGTTRWARTIHKKQSAMPGMAGHLLAMAGDRVLFVYNDDAQNATKLPDDDEVALFTSNNAMAMVQEIDASGKVQKYPLSNSKDIEGFALNFNAMGKIDEGYYFDTASRINCRKSIDSRNLTFRLR